MIFQLSTLITDIYDTDDPIDRMCVEMLEPSPVTFQEVLFDILSLQSEESSECESSFREKQNKPCSM